MFSVALVCRYGCKQHYSQSYEWIAIKFNGGVWGGKMNVIKFCPLAATRRRHPPFVRQH